VGAWICPSLGVVEWKRYLPSKYGFLMLGHKSDIVLYSIMVLTIEYLPLCKEVDKRVFFIWWF
jgi:hypothetical protein